MLSYWEKDSFVQYDIIIVGAGITGLSTAISIKELLPELRILILEKSIFPSGASTKNAGFACFGSPTELLSDIAEVGELQTIELVKQRWRGLQILRSRFTDEQLGYEALGGYELLERDNVGVLKRLNYLNQLLFPVFGADVFHDYSSKMDGFNWSNKQFSGMVFNSFEGQIDTGKTIKSLWDKSQLLGIKILTGAEVTNVNDQVSVKFGKELVSFYARSIVVCTNAFTNDLFPGLNIEPGRGMVLITQPIRNLKMKGTFHMEEGFYYFRNVNNRVLLGGGRNLDFQGEKTTKFGHNPLIHKKLLELLENKILPETDFEIDSFWSGIMAFGSTKKPITKWVCDNLFLAVRFGGMGMALGSHVGDLTAKEVVDKLKQ